MHYTLIANHYGLDLTTVMRMTNQGQLSKSLEDIKHDGWKREPAVARLELMAHTAMVDQFVTYLASSIQ